MVIDNFQIVLKLSIILQRNISTVKMSGPPKNFYVQPVPLFNKTNNCARHLFAWSEHVTKFKFKAYTWKHEQLMNQITKTALVNKFFPEQLPLSTSLLFYYYYYFSIYCYRYSSIHGSKEPWTIILKQT